MQKDVVFLKRFYSDGRVSEDEFYVKNFHEFSVVMRYVREIVYRDLAHFEVNFVCASEQFTLLGAL